jgi:hypothetical protein
MQMILKGNRFNQINQIKYIDFIFRNYNKFLSCTHEYRNYSVNTIYGNVYDVLEELF